MSGDYPHLGPRREMSPHMPLPCDACAVETPAQHRVVIRLSRISGDAVLVFLCAACYQAAQDGLPAFLITAARSPRWPSL